MATYLIYECRRKKTLKILGIISQPCFSHSRNGFLVNKRTTFSMRTDKTRRSRAPDPLDADKRDGGKLSRGRRRFGGLAVPGDLFGSWASHDRERDTVSWRGAEEGAEEAGPGEGGARRNPAARGSKRPDHVNPEEATELWAGGDGDRVPGQHGGGGVCFSLRRALRRRQHLPSPSPRGDSSGRCREADRRSRGPGQEHPQGPGQEPAGPQSRWRETR